MTNDSLITGGLKVFIPWLDFHAKQHGLAPPDNQIIKPYWARNPNNSNIEYLCNTNLHIMYLLTYLL